jgi:cytosine/adenosine deaminase-related metal-dependent hydrolase
VAHLKKLGFLNEKTTCAHSIWLDDEYVHYHLPRRSASLACRTSHHIATRALDVTDQPTHSDIQLLKTTGATPVHNPLSNLRLGRYERITSRSFLGSQLPALC